MYAIDSSMLRDTKYTPSLCLSAGDSEIAQPDTISTHYSQARAATHKNSSGQ